MRSLQLEASAQAGTSSLLAAPTWSLPNLIRQSTSFQNHQTRACAFANHLSIKRRHVLHTLATQQFEAFR
jgi:hypothetical protein